MSGSVTTELLLFAGVVFLVAGTVKGVLGIGLPTISISMLAQFVDPRVAISLLLLPALFTNTWQIYRGGQIIRSARKLWPFIVTMAVVMFVSALFAARTSVEVLLLGMGLMVVLWTITSFIRTPPELPPQHERKVLFGLGALSGLMGGLTAMWSPPMIIYLLSIRCDKEDFVRFTGLMILCGTVPLTIGYIFNGLLDKSFAVASCLMIIPTLIGFSIGEYLRKYLGGRQFQLAVLALFFLMGLNLIRRSFSL